MRLGLAWRARLAIVAGGCLLACAAAEPASAQTTSKDIQVAVRTLGFVSDAPSGTVDLAILFDPDQTESNADAEVALATLGSGLRVGALTVRPMLVPVNALDRLEGVRFALLARGLQRHYGAIAEAARKRGILTISADFACARAGQCVMAVTSEPRVQILVNRAARNAAGVEFAAAFLLMISEI